MRRVARRVPSSRQAGAAGQVRWGSSWRLVAAAMAGIVLVACGGVNEDADPVAAPVEEPVEDAPAEPEAPVTDEEDRAEGTVGEHRPTDAAVDAAGCAAVDDAAPGAFIVFPSSSDASTAQAGHSPVTVEVLGCSNTFEANVEYEAYHGDDRAPTLAGHTMGGTLGEWREFRFEETYWTPGTWRVLVLEHDAESGERQVCDEVTFEVDPA